MDLTVIPDPRRHFLAPISATSSRRLFGVVLLFLSWANTGQAEIYKFVDDNGLVTYTNMPRPGTKPDQVIPEIGQAPGKRSASPTTTVTRKPSARSSTPAYFPSIDTGTQRKRDDMRRQLLEEELSSEHRNLSAAKSAMSAGSRQPGADLKKLLDAVRLHEKNIEMLNKELSHIR
jgi:hypothetical protein